VEKGERRRVRRRRVRRRRVREEKSERGEE
jgi:hypothetical protein